MVTEATRDDLLATVAELYYRDGLTQAMVSERLGTNRSTISRMLTEAQERGIVEISIHRPLHLDDELARRLEAAFGLAECWVVRPSDESPDAHRTALGRVGAVAVGSHLRSGMVIGATWGSTMQAVVASLGPRPLSDVRVCQVAGSLLPHDDPTDTTGITARLAELVEGEELRLAAPLVVGGAEVAAALKDHPLNRSTLETAARCDLMLVGIGVVDRQRSTLHRDGHITTEDLSILAEAGAVGDACGFPFDAAGLPVAESWVERLVTIDRSAMLAIPTRLAVAGGADKAEAVRGALAGGYVSHLATDVELAETLLAA